MNNKVSRVILNAYLYNFYKSEIICKFKYYKRIYNNNNKNDNNSKYYINFFDVVFKTLYLTSFINMK